MLFKTKFSLKFQNITPNDNNIFLIRIWSRFKAIYSKYIFSCGAPTRLWVMAFLYGDSLSHSLETPH